MIIVHDGGPLVSNALQANGIQPILDGTKDSMNPKAMLTITETIESVNGKIAKEVRDKLAEFGQPTRVIQSGTTTGSAIVYGTPTGIYDSEGLNGVGDRIDAQVLSYELSRADVIVVSNLARYDNTNDYGFVTINASMIVDALTNILGARYSILR
jgi:acetylglutamate kinase